jgi:hypothetical protein
MGRHTNMQKNKYIDIHTIVQTYIQMDIHTNIQAYKYTDIHENFIKLSQHTYIHTDKLTCIQIY